MKSDLPEHNLKPVDIGTVVGTVVLLHGNGDGYEVEFVSLDGETVGVVSLYADQVRPIGRGEIAHARPLRMVWRWRPEICYVPLHQGYL